MLLYFDVGYPAKLGNVIKIDDAFAHENEETSAIKLQGVLKYCFKEEDAMWGQKPEVAGAAQTKATAEEAEEAKASAARDAWEDEEGESGVGSGDDGSEGELEEESEDSEEDIPLAAERV